MIKNILAKLYVAWVVFVFTFFMLLFLPFIVIPLLIGDVGGRITYFFLHIWSWIFSKLTFISYSIEGRNHIDRSKSYVYTSNHTSFLDAPGIRMAIPTQFRPLAKKELLKIPVFGWIVNVACVIVDRSSAESRKKSIQILKNKINKGISLLIFPEGTQNRSTEILQPFYDGAFRLAIQTQTPIMPMVVIGAGKLMAPSSLSVKPGHIKVIFGEEIPVEGLQPEDLPTLKANVFNIMKDMIIQNSPA